MVVEFDEMVERVTRRFILLLLLWNQPEAENMFTRRVIIQTICQSVTWRTLFGTPERKNKESKENQ